MMEQKKSRMSNFSRSMDKPSAGGNGVGFYQGQTGPNVVVQKIN